VARLFWRLVDRIRDCVFRRRLTPAHALGRRAEDLAHRYLEEHGYEVIDRNWCDHRLRTEIDLVARHKGQLVFIEVKARGSDGLAPPESAVGAAKRRALLRGVVRYTKWANLSPEQMRFDVLSIVFTDPPRITLHQGEPLLPRRRRNAVC